MWHIHKIYIVSQHEQTSAVGLVVEFSPATREARVRFPDCAAFLKRMICGKFTESIPPAGIEPATLRYLLTLQSNALPIELQRVEAVTSQLLSLPPYWVLCFSVKSILGRIRTCNPLIRSQMLFR